MPKASEEQLGELSPGERLLLDRRRRGESQVQAAARRGISHTAYGLMERDSEKGTRGVEVLEIGELKAHERCLLYRRRAGYTQARVAKELQVCRWWLNQMERGAVSCDLLVWYWEQ